MSANAIRLHKVWKTLDALANDTRVNGTHRDRQSAADSGFRELDPLLAECGYRVVNGQLEEIPASVIDVAPLVDTQPEVVKLVPGEIVTVTQDPEPVAPAPKKSKAKK